MTDKKEVIHLGRLTRELLEQINKCDPSETYGALMERYEKSAPEEKLEIEKEYPSLFHTLNYESGLNISAVGHNISSLNNLYSSMFELQSSAYNFQDIEKINAQRFKEAERGRFNRMNQNLKTSSIAMQKQRDEKERIEKDRHDQLIEALRESSNSKIQENEINQLKAEIEKLLSENDQLKQENEQLQDKLGQGEQAQRNSQLLLISVLFSKYKADKPRVRTQDKTLADIEEENTDIAGLSFSTTTKILADANKIYKTMKNIKK